MAGHAVDGAAGLAQRPLFGGAIQLALPSDYLDARWVPRQQTRLQESLAPVLTCSDMRQIPDNQEVFLSPVSETSVVVEILALVEEGEAGRDLWEAAKYADHRS
jgi:hypothetical protein